MSLASIQAQLIARVKDEFEGIGKLEVDSLPAELTPDILKQIALHAPGVYVVFAGGTPRSAGARATADLIGRWVFVVVMRGSAGFRRRLAGDATGAGAFALLDALIPALHNHEVDGEGTLVFAGVENLYDGQFEAQALSIYALSFDMDMAWPVVAEPEVLRDLKTLFAYWDIPAHETEAQRRKWLQGDETQSKPDAKDQVTLPTE